MQQSLLLLRRQVRQILASLQRVLGPRHAFEPSTSRRVFRFAAPDFALTLFTELRASLHSEAPGVSLE